MDNRKERLTEENECDADIRMSNEKEKIVNNNKKDVRRNVPNVNIKYPKVL